MNVNRKGDHFIVIYMSGYLITVAIRYPDMYSHFIGLRAKYLVENLGNAKHIIGLTITRNGSPAYAS